MAAKAKDKVASHVDLLGKKSEFLADSWTS